MRNRSALLSEYVRAKQETIIKQRIQATPKQPLVSAGSRDVPAVVKPYIRSVLPRIVDIGVDGNTA